MRKIVIKVKLGRRGEKKGVVGRRKERRTEEQNGKLRHSRIGGPMNKCVVGHPIKTSEGKRGGTIGRSLKRGLKAGIGRKSQKARLV